MLKKLAVSLSAVIIISLAFYYFLGGFDPINFQLEVRSLTVYGQLYEGKRNSDMLSMLFEEAKKNVENGEGLFLAVIDYPVSSKDSIKQFIGVVSKKPVGLDSVVFVDQTFMTAEITVHPLVRPLPNKIQNLAKEYALKNGLVTDTVGIELYAISGTLNVLFPLK